MRKLSALFTGLFLLVAALATPASASTVGIKFGTVGIKFAAAAPAPQAWSKTVVATGFNGDSVRVSVNWRTATDNGGSLRVVDARITPLVANTGQVDRARGFADATLRIVTRSGAPVRSLGEVGIGGSEGTLFRLGDLIQNNQGATVRVLLDVRGAQQEVVIPLVHA